MGTGSEGNPVVVSGVRIAHHDFVTLQDLVACTALSNIVTLTAVVVIDETSPIYIHSNCLTRSRAKKGNLDSQLDIILDIMQIHTS